MVLSLMKEMIIFQLWRCNFQLFVTTQMCFPRNNKLQTLSKVEALKLLYRRCNWLFLSLLHSVWWSKFRRFHWMLGRTISLLFQFYFSVEESWLKKQWGIHQKLKKRSILIHNSCFLWSYWLLTVSLLTINLLQLRNS